MAQVQQIYARLFTRIDAATSLLLKQDLVDAEFVREQNQSPSLPHSMPFKMLH
jgi:hypothetical protein